MRTARPALRRLVLLTALAAACSTAPPAIDADGGPGARWSGPVTGGDHGFPFAGTVLDLAARGFTEEEYFIDGSARAYTSVAPLTRDGAWSAKTAGSAPFRTRVLVRRPVDPALFNGTVLVEWLNVSGGLDAGPDWAFLHELVLRDGYAWVGVSAQQVGVDGFPAHHRRAALGNAGALKVWDPTRYGSLVHPGDSYSYDLYTQVGHALREAGRDGPLADLAVRELVAIGESQSASRLATYLNAVQPLAGVYDAFLVHSRGGGSAPLSEAPEPDVPAPGVVWIRDDLEVPVLTLATETDLIGLRFYPARQPDSDAHRLWEVAGTAHADLYQLSVAMRDSNRTDLGNSAIATCDQPLNDGPQHLVLKAAVHHLRGWVRDGTLPPPSPRLRVVPGSQDGRGNWILRDGHGNALGGIRTPAVDVPVATLSGEGNTGAVFCFLFGVTKPFDPDSLAALYGTPEAYRAAHDQAADDAVAAGFVLASDAEALKRAAADVEIPPSEAND